MEVKVNETYRDKKRYDNTVIVKEITQDAVRVLCLHEDGGILFDLQHELFLMNFTHVEVAPLSKVYKEMHFDFDESERTISAWTDGRLWRGRGCPLFEREVLQKAIDDNYFGDHDGDTKTIILDDGVMHVFCIEGDLPTDCDWSEIEERARAGDCDYKVAPGRTLEIEFYPKQTIIVDGREIETYPLIDLFWYWNQYDEPRNQSAPTP